MISGLALAACGSDDDDTAGSSTTSGAGAPSGAQASENFGPGCAAVPTEPANPGSFEAMAQVPVATAASGNPVLSTLVGAVTQAGLGDSLNSAEGLTVFAPTNDAFAEIPADTLAAVLADEATLTSILTYHVVGERLAPEDLAGTHDTLQGATLTVAGSGEDFTVGDTATVVCGNVQTANATVYIIDAVLMPPA